MTRPRRPDSARGRGPAVPTMSWLLPCPLRSGTGVDDPSNASGSGTQTLQDVTDGTSGWQPRSIPYAYIQSLGPSVLAQFYMACWISPVLSLFIFALFGWTAEARASYWSVTHALGRRFGWKRGMRAGNASFELGTIEFRERTQNTLPLGAELACVPLRFTKCSP